ncbi:hypothetical protein CASFOL_014600 [Castilleja foliolosa]|uniref:RNase H type-1 domain-containing protein n=1 Tax=Castilleja foliolosa TaxID=1961234 RepID=A0ABD3DNA6_9LAMI
MSTERSRMKPPSGYELWVDSGVWGRKLIDIKLLKVWQHFGDIFKRKTIYNNIPQLINGWMLKYNMAAQSGVTALCVLGFCLWESWKARCRSKFDDIPMNAANIIKEVSTQVQLKILGFSPTINPSKWDTVVLDRLRVPIKSTNTKIGKWLSWNRPNSDVYKLNVDGSFKDSLGTFGGIIRDCEGNLIFSFWGKSEDNDAAETEIDAINRGIDCCIRKGLNNVTIETDSTMAIRAFQGKINNPMLIYRTRRHRGLYPDINLIYREQNATADKLAKWARNHGDGETEKYHELPSEIRLQIYHDKTGIPKYRRP